MIMENMQQFLLISCYSRRIRLNAERLEDDMPTEAMDM